MSKETKIAIIGGIFVILAAVIGAVIGGIFLLRSTAPVQSNATPTPSLVSSTSAPTPSNSSTTFPPVATQAAQPTYSDIRGTYSLYYYYQNSGTSFGATLQITSAGNQITITYTGTGEAGTGWQGTWSGSNGTQGTWYTTGRLFMP